MVYDKLRQEKHLTGMEQKWNTQEKLKTKQAIFQLLTAILAEGEVKNRASGPPKNAKPVCVRVVMVPSASNYPGSEESETHLCDADPVVTGRFRLVQAKREVSNLVGVEGKRLIFI